MAPTPEALTEIARTSMPFARKLGLTIDAGGPHEVVAHAAWAPEHCTAGGALHGGFLMGLADSVGAMCAFLNLPDGAATSTVESKSNFFRPVTAGVVKVTAQPVHVGGRIIVVQTDIHDDEGRLVSRTIQTQAVLG
ncbi:MAG: PaaI family thioesterase [Acidimicrobiia bacterium]|nr:PaaI family thioesterase [Acidimicrobiia bacterium]